MCLDLIASNWSSLRMVSVNGGQAVNPHWCTVAQPDAPKAYVMYVGRPPSFDGCINGICISREPSQYLVGFTPALHVSTAVADILNMADDVLINITAEGKTSIGDAVAELVSRSDAGWIVGDGGDKDPCVDPHRFTTVIIIFSVFGFLLVLIILDGVLVALGYDVLRCCCGPWLSRHRTWWQPQHKPQPRKPGVLARLWDTVLALLTLRYSFAIVVDVTFDVLLLVQILPLTVGWLLLACSLTSVLVSGLVIHRFLIRYTARLLSPPASFFGSSLQQPSTAGSISVARKAADAKLALAADSITTGSSSPKDTSSCDTGNAIVLVPPPATPAPTKPQQPQQPVPRLCHLYQKLAQQPVLLRYLAALLLIPCLAVTVDVLLVVYTIMLLPVTLIRAWVTTGAAASASTRLSQMLLLGCMVPDKAFAMRSLITVVFQSFASIAFTTWGYAVTRKYNVGQFITQVTFLANLITSMAHILVQAWHVKELLVRHRGSVGAAMADVLALGPPPQLVTHKPVAGEAVSSDRADEVALPGPPVERVP